MSISELLETKLVVVTRGDIFMADLSPVIGSEQDGVRPVLIIQNDIGNRYSPTVIVAAITSHIKKMHFPTHVVLNGPLHGLDSDSVILLEQIRTIDKRRLRETVTHLDPEIMNQVDQALRVSLGICLP